MFSFGYDPVAHALVVIKSGPAETDADYQQMVDQVERLGREARGALAVVVLIIDSSQPPPNAYWRQRFADAQASAEKQRFVLVTKSAIERGILTAVTWLHPPRSGQKVTSCGTFDEAVAWLESESGPPREVLFGMRDKALQGARDAVAPKSD